MAKNTRSRIIKAAEELYRTESQQKVGIRQIAQAAGCSHTAIYQYFKKKEDILYAVAEKPLTHLYHTCLEISHSKQNDKERLLQICQTYVDFGFRERNFYELLIFYRGEHEDLGDCSQPLLELRMKSYRLLEEAIDVFLPKDLSDAEALNIRSVIFIFLHGLVSIYSRDNEECPERIKQLLTDFISFKIIEMK